MKNHINIIFKLQPLVFTNFSAVTFKIYLFNLNFKHIHTRLSLSVRCMHIIHATIMWRQYLYVSLFSREIIILLALENIGDFHFSSSPLVGYVCFHEHHCWARLCAINELWKSTFAHSLPKWFTMRRLTWWSHQLYTDFLLETCPWCLIPFYSQILTFLGFIVNIFLPPGINFKKQVWKFWRILKYLLWWRDIHIYIYIYRERERGAGAVILYNNLKN